jgi:hypothetical protein
VEGMKINFFISQPKKTKTFTAVLILTITVVAVSGLGSLSLAQANPFNYPRIFLMSPGNITYNFNSVRICVTAYEALGYFNRFQYSLDGQDNISIAGEMER